MPDPMMEDKRIQQPCANRTWRLSKVRWTIFLLLCQTGCGFTQAGRQRVRDRKDSVGVLCKQGVIVDLASKRRSRAVCAVFLPYLM